VSQNAKTGNPKGFIAGFIAQSEDIKMLRL
jgi:hypothetical protein